MTTRIELREKAYAKLGVDELAVVQSPQITPQLRMIQKTTRGAGQPVKRVREIGYGDGKTHVEETTITPAPYGPGSDLVHAWPDYLDAADDVDAIKVRAVYYSLPGYARNLLPIEAYCVAAGVSPLRILELITAVIVRMGAQASSVIAAVNHPRVVAKTVEMALTDDGVKDREVLHKHAGFLPTPAGARTSIVVQQNASATANAASVAAPPPEQTIRRLADRFNLARAIPEQVATPMPNVPVADLVEVEADEADDDVREE